MRTEAYLSLDRVYRYWLLRQWDDTLPVMASFGVNPSTADENIDDPTIRKDMGFARVLGYGGLLKMNVGAFRSTDPRAWRKATDPIGPENVPTNMRKWMEQFSVKFAVAAWGRNGNYARAACAAIRCEIPNLWCFGLNPDGTPRHTLMLSYKTPLVQFSWKADNAAQAS